MKRYTTYDQVNAGRSLRALCTGVFTFLFLSLFLIPSSCTNEEREDTDPRLTNVEESEVVLSLRLPGSSLPASRALYAEQEYQVSEVDVLVFDGTNNDTYAYSSTAYAITNGDTPTDPNIAAIRTFTVRLRSTEEQNTVDLWVITNAHAKLGNIEVGATKTQLSAALLADEDDGVTQTEATFAPFPMWGTVKSVMISSENGLSNSAVNLTRMVAKIDVALAPTVRTENVFILTSARLYNRQEVGRIVPDEAANTWKEDGLHVIAPSLPDTPEKSSGVNEYKEYMTTEGADILNTIYTFEADNTSTYNEDNTCLVVSGTYGLGAPETYYRVDFIKTSGDTDTYLDLLRNHRYAVTVQKISGPGFPSWEDALKSRPVNITANVIEWDEDGMTDVQVDGQYGLSVSRDLVVFYQGTETINILTTWEDGWTIDTQAVGFPEWLNIVSPDPETGFVTGAKDQTISLVMQAENNDTDETRYGEFYITAGRLQKTIRVEQPVVNLRYVANSASLEDGEEIARLGTTFTIDFEGTYEGYIYVYAYAEVAGGDDIRVGVVMSQNKENHDVTVIENNTWFERTIYYTFAGVGMPEQRINELTHTQPGYTITGITGNDTYIPGSAYTFEIDGDYPEGTVIAFMDGSTVIHSYTVTTIAAEYSTQIPSSATQDLTIHVKVAVNPDVYHPLGKSVTMFTYTAFGHFGKNYGLWKVVVPNADQYVAPFTVNNINDIPDDWSPVTLGDLNDEPDILLKLVYHWDNDSRDMMGVTLDIENNIGFLSDAISSLIMLKETEITSHPEVESIIMTNCLMISHQEGTEVYSYDYIAVTGRFSMSFASQGGVAYLLLKTEL
jgi:hypothetical protein